MYDFANSSFTTLILTFIYATYFTKAIAPDEITGTALWSRAVALSAFIVAIISPILGVIADKGKYRKKFLFVCTAITIFSSAMLYTPLPGQTVKALSWFIIANIAFEMGMVFYNAFLPDIATQDKIGRISGIGWGIGYIGGLAAMLIGMIAFVNPDVPWFGFTKELGQNIRATNLLVAAWYAIFSVPLFLLVSEETKKHKKSEKIRLIEVFFELRNTIIEISRYKYITRFLIARLIYNDGLITIFAFGGIYAAGTFGFSFKEIMLFGIVLNICAGIGAIVIGFLDDLLGGKNTIMISLAGLICATVMAVTATNKTIFWVAGILVGILSGPNQSASRSLMARFVPNDRQNQFFGFFAFSGKLTAFLGPLILGLVTDIFNSQRGGMSVVIVFFIIGGLVLAGVNEKKGKTLAGNG